MGVWVRSPNFALIRVELYNIRNCWHLAGSWCRGILIFFSPSLPTLDRMRPWKRTFANLLQIMMNDRNISLSVFNYSLRHCIQRCSKLLLGGTSPLLSFIRSCNNLDCHWFSHFVDWNCFLSNFSDKTNHYILNEFLIRLSHCNSIPVVANPCLLNRLPSFQCSCSLLQIVNVLIIHRNLSPALIDNQVQSIIHNPSLLLRNIHRLRFILQFLQQGQVSSSLLI